MPPAKTKKPAKKATPKKLTRKPRAKAAPKAVAVEAPASSSR